MKQKMNLFKMKEKELQKVKGGYCGCGCAYANCGGSTKPVNSGANMSGDLVSPDFEPQC